MNPSLLLELAHGSIDPWKACSAFFPNLHKVGVLSPWQLEANWVVVLTVKVGDLCVCVCVCVCVCIVNHRHSLSLPSSNVQCCLQLSEKS